MCHTNHYSWQLFCEYFHVKDTVDVVTKYDRLKSASIKSDSKDFKKKISHSEIS
jgi:hypothetical protein